MQQLVDYLASLTKQEEAGKKLITANDIREAHARGEQAIPWFCAPALLPRKPVKWRICWFYHHRMRGIDTSNGICARRKTESQRIRETIIAQLPEGQLPKAWSRS